ncbi:casein kinase 2 regulatory subunit [Martiniozyma asiatica (nom. inval.)]|nr:casein kinase 2 regulatory subunit [Martiniozyma asiatica]
MADSSYSSDMDSWSAQFCARYGHEYFTEVAPEFVEDDFNLTGLSTQVPYYREALDVILELEPESEVSSKTAPLIEHSAELLYGLIHARYILTKAGLHAMADKYEQNVFGSCPRFLCEGMHLIPVGRYDVPGVETVRLYCPNCNDIYLPPSSRYLNIDGAFFGTSFAGMFIKMFPEIERQCQVRGKSTFKLKLFGFGVNERAGGGRMKWLRAHPTTEEELEEFKRCEFRIPELEG